MVFAGLQGAGKSSFYRSRFAATHVHVSKDLLGRSSGKERRQAARITEALAAGRSVVVDNTNPTRADRAPLIALGRAFGAAVVGYLFEVAVPEAMRRNETREGRARVPAVAILATARRFEPPIAEEGFDALFRVRLVPDVGFATVAARA